MYKRPLILLNDDLAEGVYADGSGNPGTQQVTQEATCWSGISPSVQDWNGSHNVTEVQIVHSVAVEHISTAVTVTLKFNHPVTDAYTESGWECTAVGNIVTVTRPLHANAYKSGDNVTFKVWAKAADEATTRSLSATIESLECTKTANVQNRGGDGN